MKLHSEQIILFDSSGKLSAILTSCDGGFHNGGRIRVSEVHERIRWNPSKQPRAIVTGQRIPPYVRGLDAFRKPSAGSRKQSEARCSGSFGAGFEHPLHANANAE